MKILVLSDSHSALRFMYACMDAVCTLDLTALRSEQIEVNVSEENCYTLSLRLKGGAGL